MRSIGKFILNILVIIVVIFYIGDYLRKNDQKKREVFNRKQQEIATARRHTDERYVTEGVKKRMFGDCEIAAKALLRFPDAFKLINKTYSSGAHVLINYSYKYSFSTETKKGKFSCIFKRYKGSTENPKPFFISGASLEDEKLTRLEVVGLGQQIRTVRWENKYGK